jgi:hypothetical protein
VHLPVRQEVEEAVERDGGNGHAAGIPCCWSSVRD